MRSAETIRRVAVLMGTGFIDMLGFSIVLTQLPFYAKNLGASETIIGVLLAAYALAQLTASPYWGRFSDRYGRRPAVLLSLAISGAAFVLFGLAHSLLALFLARFLQGVGGGTIAVTQAYVSDVVGPSERAKALGWLTAATSAGVMIGPALGSLAVRLGPEAPGFLAAGFCAVNLAFAWRWLPESNPASRRIQEKDRSSILRGVQEVFVHPGRPVHRLTWIYTFGLLAFMSMASVLVLFLDDRFGFTERTIGWFYAYVACISMIVRAAFLGPVIDRLGEVRTMKLGIALVGTGLLTIPLSWNLWTLGIAGVFMPIGTAFLFPTTMSLVSRYSREGETGQALGVAQTFGGMSRLVAPLWSTMAYERLAISAPFWIGATVMVGVRMLAAGFRPGAAAKTGEPQPPEPTAAEPELSPLPSAGSTDPDPEPAQASPETTRS